MAGLFRPATLHDPPGLDAPSGAVRSERREVPIPVITPPPPYPVNAVGDGVALIEVEVNQQGTVSTARVGDGDSGIRWVSGGCRAAVAIATGVARWTPGAQRGLPRVQLPCAGRRWAGQRVT